MPFSLLYFLFTLYLTFFVALFFQLSLVFCCFCSHLSFTPTLCRSSPLASFQPWCAAARCYFTLFYSHSRSLSLLLSLLCSFSPCTWLCPIAVLAKQRADETVLNSVICQHIQPRELHCSMCFVCECACVCIYDYVYGASVLRCILFAACDHICVSTDVYNSTRTAPWCAVSWYVGVATHWDC